jgi:hypothetical protein
MCSSLPAVRHERGILDVLDPERAHFVLKEASASAGFLDQDVDCTASMPSSAYAAAKETLA